MAEWVLGTANFGIKYGITNKSELAESQIARIIETAYRAGIKKLDTAQSYLNSEELIGNNLQSKKFSVTTKIELTNNTDHKDVINLIKKSLSTLNLTSISSVLMHSPKSLDNLQIREINKGFETAIRKGLIENYGVSVYEVSDVSQALKYFPDARAYQIPDNIIDQRTLHSDLLTNLKSKGYSLQLRSIFLQGLLLTDYSEIDSKVSSLKPYLIEFSRYCTKLKMSNINACLSYAISVPWASEILFSVNSTNQLEKFIVELTGLREINLDSVKYLSASHIKEIDPRNWRARN